MKLSGTTRPYAVLGHPVGHSLSPVMHNAAFRSLQMDAVYLAFDVRSARLMEVLRAMRDLGFGGINLTVPLKEVAFRGLSALDESASRLGAVNTVRFLPDGTMEGHNTDGAGFLAALKEAFGTTVKGSSLLVLGTGGAGRAVALTCAAEGCERVALADVESARAERVAAEIAGISPGTAAEVVAADGESLKRSAASVDLVVQATPVGMKEGDRSLLSPDAFRGGQMAYDLIYMYPETAFMKAALEGGARVANGLGMLLHQGAAAFTIWTGREAAVEAMREALRDEVYGRKTPVARTDR
jgi:shikimate dehydrogenase